MAGGDPAATLTPGSAHPKESVAAASFGHRHVAGG